MQIALTKKLAQAMEMLPPELQEEVPAIFGWTANWTNVWEWSLENLGEEDLLVLVNNATRFAVALYEFTIDDMDDAEKLMKKAICDTLLAMNLNSELVSEYMRLAGDFQFVKNRNRQTTAWVNKACMECAFYVGHKYPGSRHSNTPPLSCGSPWICRNTRP